MSVFERSPSLSPTIQNPLDERIGYHLRRASALMQADLTKSLADLNLRPHEASVVLLIQDNPGITQSEIGRALAIQRPNMAPITAMLSARGIIERSRPDGRSQGLRLNKAGVALAQEVNRRMVAHEARFLHDLSTTERAALTSALRQIWNR